MFKFSGIQYENPTTMHSLKIIIASTREGRKGPAIAQWVFEEANKSDLFRTELIDLKEINLPFLDEPHHPAQKKYTKQSSLAWSALIEPAEAFILVTPEYNHGFPATLKNALDTVYKEWNNKPVGIVSYGGLSGGIRAVELIKPVLLALKMVPLLHSVNIPFFAQQIDETGKFNANEKIQKAFDSMFPELAKWTALLKKMREEKTG